MNPHLQTTHFVVVTYNGEAFIKKCIDAIRAEAPSSQIHVIEKGSKDEILSILDALGINTIQTNENLDLYKV